MVADLPAPNSKIVFTIVVFVAASYALQAESRCKIISFQAAQPRLFPLLQQGKRDEKNVVHNRPKNV
jgi:hypothetical protein